MARGITETDVHTAADELVAGGERPTVERIRAHLGTGSPNTVTRWLETWWKTLAPRLAGQARTLALPDAPMPVARLAQQLWEQALEAARTHTAEALAEEQAAVAQQARDLLQAQENLAAQARSLEAATERAKAARSAAEARLTDAHKLLDQQAGQLDEWRLQRDQAQQRLTALEEDLAEARTHQRNAMTAAAAERESLLAHVRSVEDRAHAQVDGARQEFLRERAEMRARFGRLQVELKVAQAHTDDARKAMIVAQQEAVSQRARADALEELAKVVGRPVRAPKAAGQLKPKGAKARRTRA